MAVGDAVGVGAQAAVLASADEQVTLQTRRGRVLLTGFTTAHFSHHISNSLLNPLLPFIRDSFQLTYGQSGWLVSAFAVSLGLSNAPIGYLADRFGARLVVVLGLVLTGFASAAIAYAGNYWQLFGLLVVLGLIAGSYHGAGLSVDGESLSGL